MSKSLLIVGKNTNYFLKLERPLVNFVALLPFLFKEGKGVVKSSPMGDTDQAD